MESTSTDSQSPSGLTEEQLDVLRKTLYATQSNNPGIEDTYGQDLDQSQDGYRNDETIDRPETTTGLRTSEEGAEPSSSANNRFTGVSEQPDLYQTGVSLYAPHKDGTNLNPEMDMEQLRAEVKRLKEHVHRLESTDGAMAAAAAQTLGQLAAMTFPGNLGQEAGDSEPSSTNRTKRAARGKRKARPTSDDGLGASQANGSAAVARVDAPRKRRRPQEHVRPKREAVPTSDSTGKRVIVKERTDQLAKEIRRKMRSTWGQAPDDQGPLPGPDQGGPDWLKGHRHPDNITYQEQIANLVLHDIHTNMHPTSIPYAQQTIECCKSAAGTAFLNFAKRYGAQIDLTAKEKGAKDNKRGRRWARKDLKQKKRSKAAATMVEAIPANVLRMDYMSSEDSSEGEDSGLTPGLWTQSANLARTDHNGQLQINDKILEVKTPRWRSAELQAMYERIDIAAQQLVTEAKGRGHAAAPLHRFKLDPLRQKRPPSDVETWMLQDGTVPDETTLPTPKRVQIGRPKGRKNKVKVSPSPSTSTKDVAVDTSTICKKSKDASPAAGSSRSSSGHPINLRNAEISYAFEVAHNASMEDVAASEQVEPLTIVALPSPEHPLMDPALDLRPLPHTDNAQPRRDTSDLAITHMALAGMQGSGSADDPQYSATWNGVAAGADIGLGTTGVSSHRSGESVDAEGGSDGRSELQDYLMRFSSVTG